MRNFEFTKIPAILIAGAVLLGFFIYAHEFPPRFDRELHASIGKALAREALDLLKPGGQIRTISRDTEAFRQPAVDILLASFQRELRRKNAPMAPILWIQTDPLRPVSVPSGDFYELLRRSAVGDVVVSLLGPPLLMGEQVEKLGPIKPKIVAFCPGSVAGQVDFRQLFGAQLLHAALAGRPAAPNATDKRLRGSEAFAQLYRRVTAADLSTISPLPGPAR